MRNLLSGMLEAHEDDRLSWPDVFEMFDTEYERRYGRGELKSLKFHKIQREDSKFIELFYNLIKETIKNEFLKAINLKLSRLGFLSLSIFIKSAIKIEENIVEYVKEDSMEKTLITNAINKDIKKSLEKYNEEYFNPNLLEMNQILGFDPNSPVKYDSALLNETFKKLISEIFSKLKSNYSKISLPQETIKLMLSLKILQHYPKILISNPTEYISKAKLDEALDNIFSEAF